MMKKQDSHSPSSNLLFLKLGGSLITDKTRPHTPRLEVLNRLGDEIAAAYRKDPSIRLILGHGSGSFGHVPARKFGTRQGVRSADDWKGFIEVWREAASLDSIVIDVMSEAGLPVIAYPPSASVIAENGHVLSWELTSLRAALDAGLLPVVYGDVVFDLQRGGTILSTEDLFAYLARQLHPTRILLAGLEPGIWADYPGCNQLVSQITPVNLLSVVSNLGASAATDVTGGMESKVIQSLELVDEIPGLEVCIFSGETPGEVGRALNGELVGTIIRGA